jgi:predicted glycogen debranching enzyme
MITSDYGKSKPEAYATNGIVVNVTQEQERRESSVGSVTMAPAMVPAPGELLKRFVGDRLRFTLADRDGQPPAPGWRAMLRTNLGRAELLRQEIIQAQTRAVPVAGASWRDLPMKRDESGWWLELPLTEVGHFKAKAYLVDPRGWQHWPEGRDVGISVHPDSYRTANSIYCAFTRMFDQPSKGPSEQGTKAPKDQGTKGPRDQKTSADNPVVSLDEQGYAVIPPSGKLRDLIRCLPHIVDTLGCRILHLLPANPTPTTFARFGRYGSPYAALDLTAIDPALVVFDKRTTGIDQFRELTYATHLRGARVFLDMVINHTGWGSVLQEKHPEWFLRQPDGTFVSPGAWGVTWEDLVELKHSPEEAVGLWDELAESFLIWCRRGVDGFRCDAGYKVPLAAWQYIIARVQQEYPEALFFLEGLGGAWEATEALLTEGGMQWAYSELFQNYSATEVSSYVDHSFKQSERVGLLIHYSETHDNLRLAARGRAWSLLRNRLCALASVSGGFGFCCGVEWLATEKIDVHANADMNWGNAEHLIPELAKLNRLLAAHPCFFDGAKVMRLSSNDSPVCALLRESEEGKDTILVLVNTDTQRTRTMSVSSEEGRVTATPDPRPSALDPPPWIDLLGQKLPEIVKTSGGNFIFTLAPGAAFCLGAALEPAGLAGEQYRRGRAQAAWALSALNQVLPIEAIPAYSWKELAEAVEADPAKFLAAVADLKADGSAPSLEELLPLKDLLKKDRFPQMVQWTLLDLRRVTLVPPGHWLLVEDTVPFRATLTFANGSPPKNVQSVASSNSHVASFPFGVHPLGCPARVEAKLLLERYSDADPHTEATIHFLAPAPRSTLHAACSTDLILLTNGRGGMARMCVDLGRVQSKYDCVLGANLHPTLPVDRHILAKRIRVWVNADGFISPLDFRNLARFEAGAPAVWNFVANAGDGRSVEVRIEAAMLDGRNTTVFNFSRPTAEQASGKQLPAQADVRLTVRLDIEDRNFHWETKHNGGADYHFSSNVHPFADNDKLSAESETLRRSNSDTRHSPVGFAFTPAQDRQLRVYASAGEYHPQPEWSHDLPHTVEQSRGQTGSGDAYSPGWFEVPLPRGAGITLVVTADPTDPTDVELAQSYSSSSSSSSSYSIQEKDGEAEEEEEQDFEMQLARAARAFLVRRSGGKTVIAGYPWFLDWGRDTLICARGLLAGGMLEEVTQLLVTFGRFEKDGTIPNTIHGEDASNRDTSDAPLWFALACEEAATAHREAGSEAGPRKFYDTPLDGAGRTIRDVLASIAANYMRGTPNGIRMDPDSGLIWSPSHFTWMDTNYPAGTPREGYPVEIQALWIRLLRQLGRLQNPPLPLPPPLPRPAETTEDNYQGLATRALASLEKLFWREDRGCYVDVLLAGRGKSASDAVVDDALRSNCLFVPSLGLVAGRRAQRCVNAALRYLVVPGALRSLAPLPIAVPLPIYGNDGRLLNNPNEPYWGRYQGDEDARRKPAYHNGTAWTWTFPVFCEALARAWNFAPEAVAAAKAYLGSMADLLHAGCLGQLPEILDGDAPHTQRGCDAQAWGVTEALRVWKLLNKVES